MWQTPYTEFLCEYENLQTIFKQSEGNRDREEEVVAVSMRYIM